ETEQKFIGAIDAYFPFLSAHYHSCIQEAVQAIDGKTLPTEKACSEEDRKAIQNMLSDSATLFNTVRDIQDAVQAIDEKILPTEKAPSEEDRKAIQNMLASSVREIELMTINHNHQWLEVCRCFAALQRDVSSF